MKVVMGLLAFLLLSAAMADPVVPGQPPNQPCTTTFFSTLVQLMPCRPAVAPFSPMPPSEACCAALRTLGRSCLCFLVNGPLINGVDRNMAMQLPAKCAANFEPCDAGV